jgi:hypothetical protein
VPSVWTSGTKAAPTRGFMTRLLAKASSAAHRANVWMSGHPVTVSLIKIGILIIVGVLTGGIGSAAAIAVSVTWSTIMFALGTWNQLKAANRVVNSELSGGMKAACVSMVGAKFAVSVVFTASALILPFSEEMATAAAKATDLGTYMQGLVTGDQEAALSSYAAGFLQGTATGEAVKRVASILDCDEYINIDDGYEVSEEQTWSAEA